MRQAGGRAALVVLAAAGTCLIVVAVVLVRLITGAMAAHPPARGTPPAAAPARTAWPARTPPVTGLARTAAPAWRHRDPLAAAATWYLAGRGGTVLAAVYDLGTGQAWRLGHGPPQAEASVVKLDILETLLSEQRNGRAGLPAGQRSLARLMIEDSDNSAATSLWYAAGGPAAIRKFNAAAGLAHTSPSWCVLCPGFPWPGWGLTRTDPADQIALLRGLVQPGTLLTSAERGYARSLLEHVTPAQRWGITGGVPPRVTVALKNGWLPLDSTDSDWQINSVGWVRGLGRDYLMAVLSTGNPTEQYGIDTIDGLAAIVWRAMR
jgi:hypothetical protein